ncbi:MAG: methionyl-tRNA formyltransferase [Spirochaetota bacterium]
MRILFAGSPAIAVPSLEACAKQFEVVGVLTNPDSQQGRGRKIKPTPVKEKAVELGLPVLEFSHLYREAREASAELGADLLVSFAYGRMFGPKFLAIFPKGGLNVHPSLLPAFRGSSPIQAAILSGVDQTGITIQQIVREMDAGDIFGQKTLDLSGTETSEDLSQRVAREAPKLLVEVLSDIDAGVATPREQDHAKATYCGLISKQDAQIDWQKDAALLSREIRAYAPWPKSTTQYHGTKLMITYALEFDDEIPGIGSGHSATPGQVLAAVGGHGLIIACGRGLLSVQRLQLQAKKELDWKSFLNGNPGFVGSILPS